jgi:hypothetical protein
MNSYTADKYDNMLRKHFKIKRYNVRIGRDLRIFIIFLLAILNLFFSVFIDEVFLPLLSLLLIAIITNTENIRRMTVVYKEELMNNRYIFGEGKNSI